MTPTREVRSSPSAPEKTASLSIARDKVVSLLKGDLGASSDIRDFLTNFGLLFTERKSLGKESNEAVKRLAQSLKKHDQALIQQQLVPELTHMIKSHTDQLSIFLNSGRLDEALGLSKVMETDRAAALALGLNSNNHQEIRKGIKTQESLLAAARKTQKELLKASTNPTSASRRRFLGKALRTGGALLGTGVVMATGGIIGSGMGAINAAGSERVKAPNPPKPMVPSIVNTQTEITLSPSPTREVTPTTKPKPTETPLQKSTESPVTTKESMKKTPEKQDSPEEGIGDKNLIEFFLGNYIRDFQAKGATLWKELPEYRDRIPEKYAKSENITFAYLGIDDTRQRPKEFNGAGWGRADVIMVISFNPRTLQTSMISIPRDLLSPEVLETRAVGDKINAATMTDYLKAASPGKNEGLPESKPLMSRILESATGLRIDGLFQTNIDFMQGYVDYFDDKGNWTPGKDGIFNRLFPDGLRIVPKRDLRDTQYPGPGYSYLTVDFKKGQEYFMDGWQLTQYARMRHADSDYGRSERQREIATSAMTELLPRIILDLSNKHTNTLDQIIEVLEEQKEVANLFEHDISIADMLSEMRRSIKDIFSKPNSGAILARLFANSTDLIQTVVKEKKLPFTSFGVSTENLLTGYNGSTNIMRGGEGHLRPNQYGNYTEYWRPLRGWVDQNVPA